MDSLFLFLIVNYFDEINIWYYFKHLFLLFMWKAN